MKVLIATLDDYPHHGGKSTHIGCLIAGLEYYGVQCEVIARNRIDTSTLKILKLLIQPLKLFGTKYYLYWRKRVEVLLYYGKLKRRLKNMDYDVISAQDAVTCTLAGRLHSDLPIVLTMHTYYGLEYTLDNDYFSLEDKLYKKLLSFELESIKYSSAIVAVDQRINEHVSIILDSNHNICKASCHVGTIANFINTELFSPGIKSNNIATTIENHITSDDDFIVICVRRLVEKNGTYFAVKAMEYIPENMNIKMLIVGEGPEKIRLERFIAENELSKRVKLVGAIDNEEMPVVYSKCDIALVPSITVNGLQEATSISAIEAMSCGIPIVASNIGGLTELISNYDNGILVPEGNSEAIAKAICELYNNCELLGRIGDNARRYIINKHSHIAIVNNYLDVFRTIKIKEDEYIIRE